MNEHMNAILLVEADGIYRAKLGSGEPGGSRQGLEAHAGFPRKTSLGSNPMVPQPWLCSSFTWQLLVSFGGTLLMLTYPQYSASGVWK